MVDTEEEMRAVFKGLSPENQEQMLKYARQAKTAENSAGNYQTRQVRDDPEEAAQPDMAADPGGGA